MCGRYVLSSTGEDLADHYGIPLPPWYRLSFNVAPSQSVPVYHSTGPTAGWSQMRWGLTPAWAKKRIGPRGGVQLPTFINARAETAAEKASFRQAFRYTRALLPANAFYEWRKAESGVKQAYAIQRPSAEVFSMAALWDTWRDDNGESIAGVAVLTTQAASDLRFLHERMPVILHPDHYALWLDPETPLEHLKALLVPTPPGILGSFPVSNRVSHVRENDADLIRPLAPSAMDNAFDER